MRWFYNLKTAFKLAIGFGFCIFLMAIQGLFAINKMAAVNRTAADLETNWMPSVRYLSEMNTNTSDFRVAELQHILSEKKEEMDAREQEMTAVLDRFNKTQEAYLPLISSPEEKRLHDQFTQQWANYMIEHEKVLALSRQNKNVEATALIRGASQQQFDLASDTLERLVALNVKGGVDASHAGNSLYVSARQMIFGVLFFAILVAFLIAGFLSRLFTLTLVRISERMETLRSNCMTDFNTAMTAMAAGDLTVSITPSTRPLAMTTRDEFGVMAHTFDRMLEQTQQSVVSYNAARLSLVQLIGAVSASAESVASTSAQLSASAEQTGSASAEIAHSMQEVAQATEQSSRASQEMAQGSEQQARSASEAAAQMEILHAAVRQVQSGGQQQQQAAQHANAGMREASKAVEEVARSSQQMARAAQQANAVAQKGVKPSSRRSRA